MKTMQVSYDERVKASGGLTMINAYGTVNSFALSASAKRE